MRMAYDTVLLILVAVLRAESTQIFFEPNILRREINDEMIPRQGINDCDQDEVVHLSGLGLTTIPDRLANSSSIKSVMLNDNELSTISWDTFDDMPQLECLNLARNRISLEALQNGHRSLRRLIFDYQRLPESSNMVSEVCSLLGPFPSLTTLSLKGADCDSFDVALGKFPLLSTVDFSDNHFESINLFDNESVDQSPLRNIHLERNRFEQFQLDYIGNYIEAVYLDGNPLALVNIDPSNKNLRLLSLAGCSMSMLNGRALYAPFLTMLDLSGNRIQNLTVNAFEFTPYLERLNLSNNELRVFPDLAGLDRLQRLSLNFNSIDRIVTKIGPASLIALSLRGNYISAISDDAFSGLTQLQELDLSQNRLRTVPPYWHFGMPALHTLNLESNEFETVSDMNVYTFLSLRTLRIKGNYVATIDLDTLKNLPEPSVLYVS